MITFTKQMLYKVRTGTQWDKLGKNC